MCGGGGSAPAPIDPMAEARAQMALEEARRQAAAQEAEIARQREAEERARQEQEFQLALSNAFTSARGNIEGAIGSRGLDVNQLNPYIDRVLTQTQASIPKLDPNPATYFGDSLIDKILGTATSDMRSQYTNQLHSILPKDAHTTAWNTSAIDPFVQQYLTTGYQDAYDQILRALQRGNINQTGYDYGKDILGQQKLAGQSMLKDVGQGVLSGYQQSLGNIVQQGYDSAGGFELGQTFDPNKYLRQFQDSLGQQQDRLEGDITSAFSGLNIFNPNLAINKAGVAQGVTGAPTNTLQAALAERQKRAEEQRGVGTQGSF